MGDRCRHAHGIHELRPYGGQTYIGWFPIPYYPEQDPYFHSSHKRFLETPTPTTALSEIASCADADDASDPGTAMTEASAPAKPDDALEDGHHVPACTQPGPRQLPREQQLSLRPSLFARRWKDEEDEESEEESDGDDEKEAIGKLLNTVRKLSDLKNMKD